MHQRATATSTASRRGLSLLALLSLVATTTTTHAFLVPSTPAAAAARQATRLHSAAAASGNSANVNTKPTLDSRTQWQLGISLEREGFAPIRGDLVLRFVENKGYEPPQGRIFVERDPLALVLTDEKGFAVGPAASWTLSEDKEDRKWGLWVQGLFEEPKYPFLYFGLHTEDDCLQEVSTSSSISQEQQQQQQEAGSSKALTPIWGGKGIPGRRLDFRFDHAREQGRVVLSNGQMTYREVEMRKVDPLGIGGEVNVGDVVEAGTAQLTPLMAV